MFDIGMGEFLVIAVIAVLILGPDRLPKAIAEGTRWLRALRDQAANARREIVNAADLDPSLTDDLRRTMSDLSDLHPRRLASSILSDSGLDPNATAAATPVPPPAAPVNSFGASATSGSFAPRPADAAPSGGPAATAAFDPDAT